MMHMFDSDRRFMLLVACSLALVVAFGELCDPSLRRDDAEAVAAPSVTRRPSRDATLPVWTRQTERLQALLQLQPLLSTRLADRSPQVALDLAPPQPVLADNQVVSYYGNPYTAQMGILGAADPETIAAQLEEQAARYDELNGPTGVVPALHLVHAVAQPYPTSNGLYLQYADEVDVQRYLALAEERGMLLFLDLQIGRSTVAAEVEKVLPYLRYPHVHLAIDPEFAIAEGQVPGVHMGSLRAVDINQAQAQLQALVEAERLPPKLLIVHQFVDSMVPDGESIERYADVDLIMTMDGFGPAAVKRAIYQRYANRPYAHYAGIKLFLELDPDLMSEEEVLSLEPRPALVMYQ